MANLKRNFSSKRINVVLPKLKSDRINRALDAGFSTTLSEFVRTALDERLEKFERAYPNSSNMIDERFLKI